MAKKNTKTKQSENKIIKILFHKISYYYDDDCLEMPDSDQEHVKDMIIDGCNQGELCYYDHEKEYRGWWHIEK